MFITLQKQFRRALGAVLISGFTMLSLPQIANAAGLMRAIGDSGPGLSIRDHLVDVVIEDGYAITTVEQVFANPTSRDIEAVYHFPVPDKGAVSEFTAWIDGQPVIGEVFEKQKARQIYTEEKAAGREAGLTEKNRHYNFEIRVSPVRAGQDTRIRLVYMQPVKVDSGIGRYVYPLKDGETDSNAKAFWQADSQVQGSFNFDLKLRSSYPVSATRLPAHANAKINQISAEEWQVSLANLISLGNQQTQLNQQAIDKDESPSAGLTVIKLEQSQESETVSPINSSQPLSPSNTQNQASANPSLITLDNDIVFYWRLAQNAPAAIDLVAHKTGDRDSGTFMMTITPGDELTTITEGRDWVFVLDQSGSMAGKYAILTAGISRALGQLRTGDRFRIIGFSDSAQEITSGWQTADPQSIKRWSKAILRSGTKGGTNLYAGTAMGLKSLDTDRTSAIVLVTDGEANVGTVEKKQFLKLMKKYDVRLFTAIMGNGANRPLLESMTAVSNGFSVSISNNDDIVGKLLEFTGKATHKAMHNIRLDINGVSTRNITPKTLKSLYRGEQLIVMGHYQKGGVVDVSLSGEISGEKRKYVTQLELPQVAERNPEIERLWAYASISDLADMADYLGDDSEYRGAIIDLATRYGLVTDYTSMVVMREEQMVARGIERKNRDRRQNEQQAASQRASNPVGSTRADAHQPAFSGSRASYGTNGGGSLSWLLLLLGFTLVCKRLGNRV